MARKDGLEDVPISIALSIFKWPFFMLTYFIAMRTAVEARPVYHEWSAVTGSSVLVPSSERNNAPNSTDKILRNRREKSLQIVLENNPNNGFGSKREGRLKLGRCPMVNRGKRRSDDERKGKMSKDP
jgi:hypothetical protein